MSSHISHISDLFQTVHCLWVLYSRENKKSNIRWIHITLVIITTETTNRKRSIDTSRNFYPFFSGSKYSLDSHFLTNKKKKTARFMMFVLAESIFFTIHLRPFTSIIIIVLFWFSFAMMMKSIKKYHSFIVLLNYDAKKIYQKWMNE